MSTSSELVELMYPFELVTTIYFLFNPMPWTPSSLYLAIQSSLKRSTWLARNKRLSLLPAIERAWEEKHFNKYLPMLVLENYQALLWWNVRPVNFYGKWLRFHLQWNVKLCQFATFKHRLRTKYRSHQNETNSRNSSRNSAINRGIILFCKPFCWAAYFDKLETKDSHIS